MSQNHRDPVCGMTGTIERYGQWFCSERCAEMFARQADAPRHRWYLDPWIWVPISALGLSTATWWWPGMSAAGAIYTGYLKKVGFPLLAGLVLGGFIDHFIPKAYIVKFLSGPRKRVILRSTALGFLASACSHGCLALTVELYRKGASTPAAISFLLASPWASLSLTFILLSLFGLKGLVLVVGALAVAFVIGLGFQQLARRGLIEDNPHTIPIDLGFSLRKDLAAQWRGYRWTVPQLLADARGVWQGVVPLGRMILGWVQLGLVLSAFLGAFVPHTVFERFFGPSLLGLVLTLGVATVLEVCSEGTAPVAFELYRHTGALGNAFAFLMGGVITDYTELAVVWRTMGRRTVLWLLALALPLVIGMGVLLNVWK